MSPLEDIYFIKKSIASKEVKNVVINPTNKGRNGNVENWFIELKSSTIAAKEIAGIPIKKENCVASFLSQPNKSAIEILAPDLETPGIIANAWAIPINKLWKYLWLCKVINLLVEISAKSMINAINIETTAIEKFERKNESENPGINSLIIPPIKIIGIVLIKIDLYNLWDIKE